jgi:hypothetical protein
VLSASACGLCNQGRFLSFENRQMNRKTGLLGKAAKQWRRFLTHARAIQSHVRDFRQFYAASVPAGRFAPVQIPQALECHQHGMNGALREIEAARQLRKRESTPGFRDHFENSQATVEGWN